MKRSFGFTVIYSELVDLSYLKMRGSTREEKKKINIKKDGKREKGIYQKGNEDQTLWLF